MSDRWKVEEWREVLTLLTLQLRILDTTPLEGDTPERKRRLQGMFKDVQVRIYEETCSAKNDS